MLIAVQGKKHPRIDAAVQYLSAQMGTHDVEHLAWTKIALDLSAIIRESPRRYGPRRQDRCRPRGTQEAAVGAAGEVRLALAAIALGTTSANPFRLPDSLPEIAVTAGGSPAGQKTLGRKGRLLVPRHGPQGGEQSQAIPAFSGVHIARAEATTPISPAS